MKFFKFFILVVFCNVLLAEPAPPPPSPGLPPPPPGLPVDDFVVPAFLGALLFSFFYFRKLQASRIQK